MQKDKLTTYTSGEALNRDQSSASPDVRSDGWIVVCFWKCTSTYM